MVGVSSQNEIEKAVAKAIADGMIKGDESLPARMTLEIAGLKLNVKFEGEIIFIRLGCCVRYPVHGIGLKK
ncbi:DUF6494 family protein [Undibacterium arcticum]